ncbi:YbhB/YbcL family Raf kinase inhibitor-like protein [Apilactobacillus micheneri]|uniref:YbhB/YbcL family Raf kinase inhibitor-like protein n=1 Tax=Apilactobacillus micheneri TaxID=1899430 RepID=A0A2S2JLK6_9LACO|nr:YbhB/YbcL family Raf kinase inhibitor-like protein [Apilactobacillus micheneri]TPR40971.1 YbhB/YbcL family Raf kinase inhibitor-like protein [Apilactobacillus micheneri]TPR42551.1 YbhB/YbcL family Raf kinase inhibitor-like protein [Apilactobacillus micheneri]TPR45520.1 YbhB/YbcL family Raf kinase inhibitor-like protein [Apilactobacillus micheneri]TPR46078.1 YbhB/YbcL family Raf kinase inhibitor-like protein [Apilactobacillus micheneri]TPR46763.1 YbhB/YbcL family Raf kinase inhibitor-like pr
MDINIPMKNGNLLDKYTKHTDKKYKENGRPSISFPVDIDNIPADTKSLAFSLTDLDSIPVCGFEWIHWIGANIDPKIKHIPENAAKDNSIEYDHGYNSLAGGLLNMKNDPMSLGYVGPTPPDKKHNYTFTVYALDKKLDLKTGFWYNEMIHKMDGHIIEQEILNLPVEN